MAHGAMGLASAAHPQLAVSAPRSRLRRRRPRRLHDDARGRRVHRRLREGDRRAGPDRHDRDLGVPDRRRLSGRHGPGRVAVPDRRARHRLVQRAPPARRGRTGAVVGGEPHAHDLPQPGSARRRWRAGGGGIGERRADRQRAPTLRASGHPGRGRTRPGATPVPGAGHPLVDGGSRRARRALRRGGRHRPGPPGPVDAARRLTRTGRLRPERAHGHRRAAGRAPRRHPRRSGPVLRVAAEQVRAGRPQARSPARHHRRVGYGERPRRLGPAAAPLRADDRGRADAARPRPQPAARSRRSSGRPGTAPTTPGSMSTSWTARAWSATTVGWSTRRGCTSSAHRSSVGASRASSTGRAPTPRTSSSSWRPTSTVRRHSARADRRG